MDSTSIQFRSHTALLLAAALPYLQPPWHPMAELAMKFLELSETMKLYRETPQSPLHTPFNSPTAEPGIFAIISRYVKDPEGLLCNLSAVCTGKEKELVNLLLSLIRAKNIYDNYGDILSTFMSGDGFNNPFVSQPAADNTSPEDCSGPDMSSILSGGDLSSMLSKEQTDTLNLLKNLLDAE